MLTAGIYIYRQYSYILSINANYRSGSDLYILVYGYVSPPKSRK